MIELQDRLSDTHRWLVGALLQLDPLSEDARKLRDEIAALERRDPTLLMQRVLLFTDHVFQVGELPPAERQPAGVLLI
jgi:hypothetical protein